MIYELNHFGIFVQDLEEALHFFRDGFGFEVVFKALNEKTDTDIVYLQVAGGMIELLAPRTPSANQKFGVDHIAFLSNDLDADYERLVGMGAGELERPRVAGTGEGRLAYVTDPNGASVELIQRDLVMRRAEPVDHEHVVAFDHYSMYANDLTAARRFYSGGLGMENLITWPIPERNLVIDYLHYGYDVLELLHEGQAMDSQFPHFALRVKNVDVAVESLARKGIKPSVEPWPLKVGTGKQVQFTDSNGVTVELLDRVDLRELEAPAGA